MRMDVPPGRDSRGWGLSRVMMPQHAPSDTASPLIAVTGATGALGGRVARQLSAAGVPLRLVVRDSARAPRLPGAQVVENRGGYADRH